MTTETDFLNEILACEPLERPANRFPLFNVDQDGDCLEVILSSEPYNGERVDGRITIYRGIDSGEVVGLLVKGLSTWIDRVLENYPGLMLDLKGSGRFQLELFFAIEQYKSEDPKLAMCYRNLKKVAEKWSLNIEEISFVPSLEFRDTNHGAAC